jgi:hypothetical protein
MGDKNKNKAWKLPYYCYFILFWNCTQLRHQTILVRSVKWPLPFSFWLLISVYIIDFINKCLPFPWLWQISFNWQNLLVKYISDRHKNKTRKFPYYCPVIQIWNTTQLRYQTIFVRSWNWPYGEVVVIVASTDIVPY